MPAGGEQQCQPARGFSLEREAVQVVPAVTVGAAIVIRLSIAAQLALGLAVLEAAMSLMNYTVCARIGSVFEISGMDQLPLTV